MRDSTEDEGGATAMKGKHFSSASQKKKCKVSRRENAQKEHTKDENKGGFVRGSNMEERDGGKTADLLCEGRIRSRSAYQSNQNGHEVRSSLEK